MPDGSSARIIALGCDGSTARRFEAMGFVPGAVISKMSSSLNRGPVVVRKGGGQMAFAYEIARTVLVAPIE
jgi:Fe2+ transport system protein FeoA